MYFQVCVIKGITLHSLIEDSGSSQEVMEHLGETVESSSSFPTLVTNKFKEILPDIDIHFSNIQEDYFVKWMASLKEWFGTKTQR